MDLKLSREEKENLVAEVTNLAFDDTLNKEDYVDIIRVCLDACKRRTSEIEKEIGIAYSVIQ